jgi:ribosomal protein S18 acetylase RimI-like enzyme
MKNDLSSLQTSLPQVRRLEAAGFRAFPSTRLVYDGTWAVRLTAGNPAKRLNSVTPLDPVDTAGMEKRVELARQKFIGFGRPLIFRMSPLAPAQLDAMLRQGGWPQFDKSIVMTAELGTMDFSGTVDHVPLRNAGKWVDAYLQLSGDPADRKPGLVEIFSSIQSETGLFLVEAEDGEPVSVVRCVCENDLAGIFELETGTRHRRRGHGRAILMSALSWARKQGARTAWLQVVADNDAAVKLYQDCGFAEIYHYVYRSDPEGAQ